MVRYLAGRLLSSLLLLLIISLVVFLFTRVAVVDPAETVLGGQGSTATPEQLERLRQDLGLDRPLYVQYFSWLAGVVTGNLGNSFRLPVTVWSAIGNALPVTLQLTILGTLFSIVVGVGLGLISTLRQRRLPDVICSGISVLGQSIPNFWLGLILIYVGALVLGIFPAGGYVPLTDGFWQSLWYMTLPAITVGMPYAGVFARFARGTMIAQMESEHVRAARAKGLGELHIVLGHALRNSLSPLLTVVSLNIAILMAGAVVTEKVFSLPGVGSLLIDALLGSDLPIIQSAILYIAAVVVLMNLAVDFLYGIIDPRVRVVGR